MNTERFCSCWLIGIIARFVVISFSANIVLKTYSNIAIFLPTIEIFFGEEEMGGYDRDSKEERERGQKQVVKKVESYWKRPLGRRVWLASKCVLDLNYSHVQCYLTETEIIF